MTEAAACLVLAVAFKLDAIPSIGSAIVLLIFTLMTAAHFRVEAEIGAGVWVLAIAIARGLGQGRIATQCQSAQPSPGASRP